MQNWELIFKANQLKNYKKTLKKNTQAEAIIQETIDLLHKQFEYVMALEKESEEWSDYIDKL